MELAEIRQSPENAQEYIRHLESHILDLQDELRLALYRKFGRSSEKLDPSQLEFFSEQDEQTESQEESEAVSVAG